MSRYYGEETEGTKNYSFSLSMQILADGLLESFPGLYFHKGADANILEGICFYQGQNVLDPHYVYLAKASQFAETAEATEMTGVPDTPAVPGRTERTRMADLSAPAPAQEHCSLIILGECSSRWDARIHSRIMLPGDADIFQVFNLCQEIFRKNFSWADKLQSIVIGDGSIDDLCKASYPYFQNPLFIHDSQFNILSCPVWKEGMILHVKDEVTGLMSTPQETINEFKTNQEYQKTMKTHGAHYFSADLRGYRDIYVNIWSSEGQYEGRLCVCELESPLLPGQFSAAEYLAEMARILLARRSRQEPSYNQALDNLLTGMLNGNTYAETTVSYYLAPSGWHIDDEYVCVRLNAMEIDRDYTSPVNVCNYIESQVAASKSFFDDSRVFLVTNLSMNQHYTSEVASVLREGLYKAGYSSRFHNFMELEQACRQADIALLYCQKINDTRWSLTFEDIALDYIADTCCPELSAKGLCAWELKKLQEYDAAHQSDLYLTLKTYLQNERNTVLTSKTLYISRSTLFYRLKKITEITGLRNADLADPRQNLYLRMSIYLLGR